MKIRIVTALLAASVFSLPVTIFGQIRVRSFDHYSHVLTKTVCRGQQFDFNWFEDTYYHVADNSVTTEYDGSTCANPGYDPCYARYVHTDVFWPSLSAMGSVVHEEYDAQGNLIVFSEHETDPFNTGIFSPWRRCNRTVYTPQSQGAFSWTQEDHINESVTIDLVTGGTPGVTGQRLWRLNVEANDSVTGQPIPPNQITLLGKTAYSPTNWYPYTNIGVVYKVLSDHTVVDATPTIPGDCVTYDVKAFPARLLIKWGNMDVTGKTNVVWVGEKIELSCVLSSQIGTITNYFWQVGGPKIKDWILGGPGDAMGTNNRTATVLQWGYNSNRTSATTQFIWVEGSTNTVTCTVQVAGETLVAQTKFEVRRPEASWTVTPWSSVAVVSNVCDADGNASPYYHLCVGRNCETNTIGMIFSYQMTDLKGYTGPFKTSFLQLVKVDWLENLSEPPWGPAQPGGFYSREKRTKGIDTRYPYKDFGPTMSGIAPDSPASFLAWSTRFEWRTDEFETYLLWQPTRGPSIPVPLKTANWKWKGQARRLNANTPPLWGLVLPVINPQAATGIDVYMPPTWTNNVRYVPSQYNTYWFTE